MMLAPGCEPKTPMYGFRPDEGALGYRIFVVHVDAAFISSPRGWNFPRTHCLVLIRARTGA